MCTVKLFLFFFCAKFDAIFNFANFATTTFDIDLAIVTTCVKIERKTDRSIQMVPFDSLRINHHHFIAQ